ncbi:MAG: hypothetical protein Q8M47_05205 [Devosia sp.]|jgi:hypothetical protein|nr:hypothetical protein [Devosia sp.]
MTEKDALGAHVRDEPGLPEVHTANPLQDTTRTARPALPQRNLLEGLAKH